MRRKKSISLIIICVVFSALVGLYCRNCIHIEQALLSYFKDPSNQLKQNHKIGDVNVELRFEPSGLINRSPIQPKNLQKNIESKFYDNKYFFVLEFSCNNKELLRQLPYDQYSEMVQVFSFRMSDYIEMAIDESGTIYPINCIFLQTYGMSNANRLMISFDGNRIEHSHHLKLFLREFGLNIGNQIFEIDTDNLKNAKIID